VTGRHVASSPTGRHVRPGRARAAAVGFRRSPTLAAGVILTVAASGAGLGAFWQSDVATPRLVAASELAPGRVTLEPGSTGGSNTLAVTAGPGTAGALQDPVPLDVGTPAVGVTPVRLSIPSIGVDSPLDELTRDSAGVLLPPAGLENAGWYSGSAVPGATGPAVLAGHVDDTETAGVFARLRELAPGAEIIVTLSDGTARKFVASHAVDVAKTSFPTEDVYGPTPTSQLRLITCNGPYDFDVMHYSNNLIVYADAES
jgi:sortase (surface protein transpeptidase)